MTFREARDRGITRVRLPEWNEWAYIELSPVNGPWAQLFDPVGSGSRQPVPILAIDLLHDGCDRYVEAPPTTP